MLTAKDLDNLFPIFVSNGNLIPLTSKISTLIMQQDLVLLFTNSHTQVPVISNSSKQHIETNLTLGEYYLENFNKKMEDALKKKSEQWEKILEQQSKEIAEMKERDVKWKEMFEQQSKEMREKDKQWENWRKDTKRKLHEAIDQIFY